MRMSFVQLRIAGAVVVRSGAESDTSVGDVDGALVENSEVEQTVYAVDDIGKGERGFNGCRRRVRAGRKPARPEWRKGRRCR